MAQRVVSAVERLKEGFRGVVRMEFSRERILLFSR